MEAGAERKISGILRISLAAVVILLQLFLVFFLARTLMYQAIYAYIIIEMAAVLEIIRMVSKNKNSSYTIAWIIIIFLLPVSGHILYILWGRSDTNGRRNRRTLAAINRGNTFLFQDEAVREELGKEHPYRHRISAYLERKHFPVYQKTQCRYFPLGEHQFDAMIQDMEKAERFIFLEYFILNDGILWDRILEVLILKASRGVEVRLMFDDLGSIVTAPDNLIKTLQSYGIQAIRFNPVHKWISNLYINYRNHQKITVIDGIIGYTGGTNIADEYANLDQKYGHWKDTAIRLEGDAVWSLTVTFLQMWEAETREEEDYGRFRSIFTGAVEDHGFFQPFTDGPVNNPDNPAEVLYRNMISGAEDYVYITTPYLVINNTMTEILCTAAQGGIDVRIITPKIPDHWYVHMVTRSNYRELLEAGVRIYEYTPGYIHAKTVISDDEHAVIGSINMDFRSFYVHFENAVWICGDDVLKDIKADMLEIFAISEEINLEEWNHRPWYIKPAESLLRIFAVVL